MKTLALMVGALALALLLFRPDPKTSAKNEVAYPTKAPKSVMPTPTPAPTKPFIATIPPPAHKADLVHLQGQILRATDDGVLMICTPSHPLQNRFAIAREQESEMSLITRRNYDAYKYGPLFFLQNGRWRQTKDYPNRQAEGKVLLANVPNSRELRTGEAFQVIAVKTGDFYSPENCEVYTVSFNYLDLPPR